MTISKIYVGCTFSLIFFVFVFVIILLEDWKKNVLWSY